MRLSVKNIGPIKTGSLEFTDKVLVVGGNSSGKTFLSTAFYLMNSPFLFPPLSPLDIENIPERAGELELDIDVRNILENNRPGIERTIEDALKNVFGTELPNIISFGEEKGVIENEKMKITISKDGITLDLYSMEKVHIGLYFYKIDRNDICTSVFPDKEKMTVIGNEQCLKRALSSFSLTKFLSSDWNPIAYLSTERITFLNLYPMIAEVAFSFSPRSPVKPLVLDALKWIYPGNYELLGHRVEIDGARNVRIMKEGKNVSRSLVSTGLYQYSLIESVLNNPVVRGAVVEEPEINLHVDAQIEIAERIASYNKKLFITTHSEWIAMALGHMMRDGIRIYEIYDGEVKPVRVYRDGTIDALRSIAPTQQKWLDTWLKEVSGEVDEADEPQRSLHVR
ncbi:hypothetical protein L3N51_02420 [Metallosphaera sp. J1]|uniref:ATP-binding protein n=1 Tax=Metallosphaera javensis (ex Hofmann et al. 2022) TaxID=99938 RepID=UPI001EDD187D|nr:ATP-binding protein [Metallosphaera javensis (ex Hofmann et al. 2022)]MCG3110123.1 hypothetical protein [Metallosphaera javensis (ex Hofmann et al. 2022)]